jgi:hypothetical protein
MPMTAIFLPLLVGMLSRTDGAKPFDPGPPVGDRLPVFEAMDQDGRPRTFETLRGTQGLVLLFFRSADW